MRVGVVSLMEYKMFFFVGLASAITKNGSDTVAPMPQIMSLKRMDKTRLIRSSRTPVMRVILFPRKTPVVFFPAFLSPGMSGIVVLTKTAETKKKYGRVWRNTWLFRGLCIVYPERNASIPYPIPLESISRNGLAFNWYGGREYNTPRMAEIINNIPNVGLTANDAGMVVPKRMNIKR